MIANLKNLFANLNKQVKQKSESTKSSGFQTWFERAQFSMMPTQRAELYDMLGALITDGKPLDTSIRELKQRYVAKKRPLASSLTIWLGCLDEGKAFSESIKGYASETEAIIIAATEKSGDLSSGFAQASSVARASAEIRSTIIAEMTTPVIQIIMLFVLLIGFSVSMAPQLMESVPLSAMDDSQRALFELSGIIAKTWMYIIPSLSLVGFIAMRSVPRYSGTFRHILDKIPPWSIYRIYSSATFMISLSALIKAGIPIESAIRFIRQQSSPWMKEHLSIMTGRMRAGIEQGEAMDTGLLSDRVSDMVAIYSSTADFDAAINTLGKTATEDGLRTIKKQAGLAKTISMVLIGFAVGWILISVMAIGDAAKRASDMSSQQNSSITIKK